MVEYKKAKLIFGLRKYLLAAACLCSLFLYLLLSLIALPSQTATAAASTTVNFQARLMAGTGAIVPDGNYNVEFKLYNALSSSGSSQGSCTGDSACLWTETRTSANKVRVANGYLTVELGSVTSLPSIDWSQNLYLSMNIGGTGTPGWDGEMSPRLHLTAVPYAFAAKELRTTNGSFTSTLNFIQPTANRTIQAPDESGTICLQSSTACGFAASSGSGSYIQNGTSLQSGANFNISGTGTAATSLQAPLLDTASAVALNIGTTNATAINLNKSTVITGGISQSTGAISLAGNAASSITTSTGALTLTAAGTSNWTVGGTNQSLTITTSGTGVLTLGTTGAGTVTIGNSSSVINIGATNNARTVHIADGGSSTTQAVIIGSTNGASSTTIQGGTGSAAIGLNTAANGKISIDSQGSGGINALLGSNGFTLKTTTDSSYALAVKDSNDLYMFSVSTSSGMVTLGALQATYSGFDETLNTPFGNLTLGATNNALTIKGSSSMTLQATSGSFTTTVGFITPTANRAINLPNESGTVCLQSSTACGFAPTSGSANYIQNTTSTQSANMYVQAATTGTVAATLQAFNGGTGAILQLKNGTGTNVAVFGSAGAVSLQNSTNTTAAFQVSASAGAGGNSILRVDSTNERVAIGVISDPIGAKLSVATSTIVGLRVFQGGSSDSFQMGNSTADFLTVSSTGNWLVRPTTNSTTAFQIQNANATSNLFFADTTNTRIAIGQATASYTLDVAGDVNSSTAYRVAGTIVCDSTGCTAKSGSSFYIRNQATVQSANMYVQAATSGSVAAVLQANAAGSGDILDLKNGSGTNVATFSSTGAVALRNSTNSSSALQVQNAAGGQVLNVSTSTNTITLNGTNSPALNTWQSTTSLNTATSFAASAISNGYMYQFGGYGSGYLSTVQYAKIGPTGAVGTWSTTTALPAARAYAAAAVSAGYIYVLGGTPGSGNTDTIYVAKQSSDGVIAAWQTSNQFLPDTLNAMSVVVAGGYLYVIGGTNGSTVTSVYYAQIYGDGSLGDFQTGTSLPTALANAQAVVSNGYIYFLGGYNGTSAVSTAYYSAINASTGANGTWNSTTALPVTANNFGAVVSNGYVYIARTGSIYYAPINTNGTLGSWTQDTNSVPISYNGAPLLNYNGYNYYVGGYNGSTGTSGVYYATGSRTYVAGTLDLVGLSMQGSGYTDDTSGSGSTGGSLIAGNTTVMGTLQVQGQSNFAQNVAINGSLTVGNDVDSDDNSVITVASRGYAGIELLGDMGNGSGEVGGAYMLYAQDDWGTQAISGMIQVADESPQGDTYTGTLANAFLVGMYNNFALQLGTNSTVRLTVMNSGNVCIAVTSCTKKLGVSGTIGASGAITASTTPDLAETIPAASDVTAADVVMADPTRTERVIKSNRAYNTAAVGVVSDGTSSFMINANANAPDAPLTGAPVVLVGRVPVKVTDEGGAIKPGDQLTTASKPGYAMKATHAGQTIGTALGSFSGHEGTVLVFVNLGYTDAGQSLQSSSSNLESLNVSGNAVLNRLYVSSVSVSGNQSIGGNLTVSGATNVGQITIGGHIITAGSAPTLTAQEGSGTNAEISLTGNDTSGIISIKVGANATDDPLVTIHFATSYGAQPRVILTPVGKASAKAGVYVDSADASSAVIAITQIQSQDTELKYNYQIMQ